MTASAGNVTGRIFMSYRREDTAYPAGWLYDRLAGHFDRGQVFKDIDSIELGDDFVEVITTAVGSCDVLLVLIGDRWLTVTGQDGGRRLDNPDDFVRLEIEAALTRDVRVIPILVEGARMPRADELPASLTKLARRQALELSPSRFDVDSRRLLRVLERTITEAQEQARRQAEEAAAGKLEQLSASGRAWAVPEYTEHEEHLAHLRHLSREDGRDSGDNGDDSGGQSTGRRMIRRVRTHPVAAAVIAGAAAVVIAVIAVVAAFSTTGHNTAPPPSGAPSPGGSSAAAGAPASVPSFTATYTMTRHINVCSPAGSTCITGPLPLTIDCNGSSCTASSSHWNSSHQLAFNGSSFSFTGTDSGVYRCDSSPVPTTITLNLTVVSWSGSGATRKPQQLSGPYNLTAPATGVCSAWHLEATLTSQ